MERIDALNLAQRIVLVIASGLVIRMLTVWLLIENGPRGGGWFGYPPNTEVLFRRDGSRFSGVVTAFVVLVAVGVWTLLSLRILATPSVDE